MAGPTHRFRPDDLAFWGRFGLPPDAARQVLAAMRIPRGARVLEVGCGSGNMTKFLLDGLGDDARIVAVDHDEDLLAVARKETESAGERVRFERADAFKLPFADGEFDAVVSAFLLCVLPRPFDALREMARVARPGGVVSSVSCFCKSGGLPPFHGLGDWPGKERYLELEVRFRSVYRTLVRNPGLGLPNGRDLDVWGDYARVGLDERQITGFMTAIAPADSRWTPQDVVDYVARREKVELGLLDALADESLAKLEAGGFSRAETRELRGLLAEKYRWLKAEPERGRGNADVMVDPMVVISGRVPRR